MNQFRMIACPSISHERRQDTYVAPGRTVGECLQELGWQTDGLSARVFIDGKLIPDAEWLDAKPTAGQSVVVRRVFTGGGGNTGKQVGQIVGMLLILVAAAFAPEALAGLSGMLGASGGVFGGILGASGAISAGLSVAGILALNGLIPPALPRRLPMPIPMRALKEAA